MQIWEFRSFMYNKTWEFILILQSESKKNHQGQLYLQQIIRIESSGQKFEDSQIPNSRSTIKRLWKYCSVEVDSGD